MPRCLSLPSLLRSPPQISRSEWARPSWQNSIATNCPQHVKPRAWRSAYVRFTRAWNSVRGNSLSSWLNMLENPLTGDPPVLGGVEPWSVSTPPYPRGAHPLSPQFDVMRTATRLWGYAHGERTITRPRLTGGPCHDTRGM